jgi:uncharacterized membrane protein
MKLDKYSISLVLPIIYLFFAVLVFGENIKWFYALSISLVLVVSSLLYKAKLNRYQVLAYALLVLASIGLAAASLLTIEKLALAADPDYVASCSVSPVVSCNNVISSEQASAIRGIPNPIFGLFSFTALIVAAMTLFAGAKKLHKYYWWAMLGGAVLGVAGSLWLFTQGIYRIGSLCLYCMAVWFVVLSIFWFVLDFTIKEKAINLPKKISEFITTNRNVLITASIGILVILIYFRWSEYWNGLL